MKDKKINLRVTNKEKEEIKSAALAQMESVSEYVMRAVVIRLSNQK